MTGLPSDFGIVPNAQDQLLAGDTNGDYFFDEADWILAMRSGKFQSGSNARWDEGDFDADGDFDTQDFELARSLGRYDPGGDSYSGGQSPLHTRRTLHRAIPNADIDIVYLEETGTIAVVSSHELTSFHLHSRTGLLVEAPVEGSFDVRSRHSAFWLQPDGLSAAEGLVLRGQVHLTMDQLVEDLSVDATRLDGAPIGNVSLSILVSHQSALSCIEILSRGGAIGDSNLDNKFDSSDLVYVFQRGEYDDGIDGNSNWHDGDWNCDGEFDSADIVEAFTAGGFEVKTNAASAVAVIRQLVDESSRRRRGIEFGPRKVARVSLSDIPRPAYLG